MDYEKQLWDTIMSMLEEQRDEYRENSKRLEDKMDAQTKALDEVRNRVNYIYYMAAFIGVIVSVGWSMLKEPIINLFKKIF